MLNSFMITSYINNCYLMEMSVRTLGKFVHGFLASSDGGFLFRKYFLKKNTSIDLRHV